MYHLEQNAWMSYVTSEDEFHVIDMNYTKGKDYTFTYEKKDKKDNDDKTIDTRVRNLEASANVQGIHQKVESASWIPEESKMQDTTAKQTRSESFLEEAFEALKPKKGDLVERLVSNAPLSKEQIQRWAKARIEKEALSLHRYRMQIDGISKIDLGDTVELKNIGELFNKKVIVTGIKFQMGIGDEGSTHVQLGLANDLYHEKVEAEAPPASGLLPGIHGLHIGVVQKASKSSSGGKDKAYYVPVNILSFQASHPDNAKKTVLARLACTDAGVGKDKKPRGVLFVPEPGDTVVIGFINEDPRHPIILGSLYTDKNKLPLKDTKESGSDSEKGIVTKENLQLVFNDKSGKESIQLSTPRGDEITLGTHKDNEGITIKSSKDLVISAKGEITIKSEKKIDLQSKEVSVN